MSYDFENQTARRGIKHRGEHGNVVVNVLPVVVPAGAVATSTILVDTGPWDAQYVEMSLGSAGNTGLIVDVGVKSNDEVLTDPDFFAGSVDLSAAGKDDLLNLPVVVRNAGEKVGHEIYVTLSGTVTAGMEFTLVTKALYFGAPE